MADHLNAAPDTSTKWNSKKTTSPEAKTNERTKARLQEMSSFLSNGPDSDLSKTFFFEDDILNDISEYREKKETGGAEVPHDDRSEEKNHREGGEEISNASFDQFDDVVSWKGHGTGTPAMEKGTQPAKSRWVALFKSITFPGSKGTVWTWFVFLVQFMMSSTIAYFRSIANGPFLD
jgi:hypothetical protein